MSLTENTMPQPAPLATAGIDWASEDYAVCVVDTAGEVLQRATLTYTKAGLSRLIELLTRYRVGGVRIERPDGPVVDALLAASHTVYVVPPSQVKALPLGRRQTTARRHLRLRRRRLPQNAWAANLYARARARGHDHPHAVRILARAWVDIHLEVLDHQHHLRPPTAPSPPTAHPPRSTGGRLTGQLMRRSPPPPRRREPRTPRSFPHPACFPRDTTRQRSRRDPA
jgi:hypothetical protein